MKHKPVAFSIIQPDRLDFCYLNQFFRYDFIVNEWKICSVQGKVTLSQQAQNRKTGNSHTL